MQSAVRLPLLLHVYFNFICFIDFTKSQADYAGHLRPTCVQFKSTSDEFVLASDFASSTELDVEPSISNQSLLQEYECRGGMVFYSRLGS